MLTVCETVGKITVLDTVGKAMVADPGVSTDVVLLAGVSTETIRLADEIETVRDIDCIEIILEGGVSRVTN
jgi:hypothetical protein